MGYRVSKVDSEVSNSAGQLYVVATPIGNRDDITLRAIDTLRGVDRVFAEDTRHSRRLLAHLAIDRPLQSLHEHNEHEIVERVIGSLQAGESLALISDAGTPLISDPGYPLIRACHEHGIAVIAIPGPSALVAALSVCGLPTDHFRFEGFLPRRHMARVTRLKELCDETATLVFYESAHRVVDSLRDMHEVFGPSRLGVVARELTKLHETIKRAPLAELVAWVEQDDNQQRGEFVVLLAGFVRDDSLMDGDLDHLLRILLEELPLRQAAGIAARVTGQNKNRVYQRALALDDR